LIVMRGMTLRRHPQVVLSGVQTVRWTLTARALPYPLIRHSCEGRSPMALPMSLVSFTSTDFF